MSIEAGRAPRRLVAAGLLACVFLSPSADGSEFPKRLAAPPRPSRAPSGSLFAASTRHHAAFERQRAAVRELQNGNIPSFLRDLQPVRLTHVSEAGDTCTATIFVTSDYLAIGSDEDFIRIPLSFPDALEVARGFRCILPTRKMVDAVQGQAGQKLRPIPLPAGPGMRSTDYTVRHQRLIESQRQGRPPGELTSGHKKDVVLSRRLLRMSRSVAIYGWYRDSEPIQPLSTAHGDRYADYSHGVRLVADTVDVDGARVSIYEALADPGLAPILSYEGPMPEAAALMRLRD